MTLFHITKIFFFIVLSNARFPNNWKAMSETQITSEQKLQTP